MKKKLLFVIAIVAIPFDYVLWNLIFGISEGFVSWQKCVDDNFNQWKELSK
jgi:hypothetical protein